MEGLDLSLVPMDLIMNIINIIVLYVIVRALVYKPVRKFLDSRRERLQSERDEADNKNREAEQLKADYTAKLGESEALSKAALRRSEEEAKKKADEIVDGARADAKKLIDDAQRAAELREAHAVEKMKSDVVDLSLSIASKVVGRSMTDADNKRLAEEFFDKEAENIN